MLMNEEFIRCPKCNGAFFQELKEVQLRKEGYERDKTPYVLNESLRYICVSCQSELPTIYSK